MKRRLMFLTYLLLTALCIHTCYSIWSGWYDVSSSFKAGYKDGINSHQHAKKERLKHIYDLTIHKTNENSVIIDSVLNQKSKTLVPIDIVKINTRISVENSKDYEWINTLLAVPFLAILIAIIIIFLQLMSAIGKAIIFTSVNICRLRLIGFGLFALGFIYMIIGFLEWKMVHSGLAIEGYELVCTDLIDFSLFTNGLIAFLIAEVFTIGLKMQQEQELTI